MECSKCSSIVSGLKFNFKCGLHFLCQSCYETNTTVSEYSCEVCLSSQGGVLVLIDNSNIWIEAKKVQSVKKNFTSVEDPRLRIDIGNLMDMLITKERKLNHGYIFGSRPPSNDTFWRKYGEISNCEIITFDRSRITGKEKQVDTAMSAKIIDLAYLNKLDTRTVMVVLTGDQDFLPALERVIKLSCLSVELWTWKASFSKKMHDYISGQKQRMCVYYLDSFIDRFTFTSWEFNLESTDMQTKAHEHGVVLSLFPGTTTDWKKQVEKVSRWPFRVYKFSSGDDSGDDKVLIVFEVDRRGTYTTAQFLSSVKMGDEYVIPCISDTQTYTEYRSHLVQVDWDAEENWDAEAKK